MELAPEKLRALPVQVIELRDGLVLKRGRIEVRIQGEGVGEIVRELFAAASGEGIPQEDLLARFPPSESANAAALIEHLLARRLLVRGDGDGHGGMDFTAEGPASVFYWHFGRSEETVTGRLNEQRILIVGVNFISRQLAASLAACGFGSVETRDDPLLQNHALFDAAGNLRPGVWPAGLDPPTQWTGGPAAIDPESFDCLVAASDFGATSLLRPWNEFCHLHRRLFLPVVLKDLIGYVGPVVFPGETACLECLRQRERTHEPDPYVRRVIDEATAEGRGPVGFLPPMASSLGDVAAIELVKLFGLGPPLWRAATLIEVNLLAPDVTARRVLKVPRCPVCTPLNERPSVSVTRPESLAASWGDA